VGGGPSPAIHARSPGIIDGEQFTTYFRRPTRDLYFDYQLSSTITQIESAQVVGTETINGRACHKITGTAVMILSGRRNNERPVSVWIDAESRLIRRVFEDTP